MFDSTDSSGKMPLLGDAAACPAQDFCYDVEVFPNYVGVGFIDLKGNVLQFSNRRGNLDELGPWWDAHTHCTYFGFNSTSYDDHILHALLNGVTDTATIYALSGSRINAVEKRPKSPLDGIVDMRLVLGGDNVGSLKELGIKLDHPVLRELPYPFDTVLTPAQMAEVEEYNVNDLLVTLAVRRTMGADFAARRELESKYDISAIKLKESSLAVEILRKRLFNGAWPNEPTMSSWAAKGATLIDPNISFTSDAFRDAFATIQAWEIKADRVPLDDGWELDTKKPAALAVKLDETIYSVGMGGLHSKDTPAMFHANDEYEIIDIDVQSFYPNLIRNLKLCPRHLASRDFGREFSGIIDERVRAKKEGNKALNLGLKLAINSVFGKFGTAYGWLRDPLLSWQTTINGQLIILMMAEMMAKWGTIISANTDGVMVWVRREDRKEIAEIVEVIQEVFSIKFEFTDYKAYARRDVNNYVAIETNGRIKGKGAYAYDTTALTKKATERVVIDAVQAYFADDKPLRDTICACSKVTSFINYFKASSGYRLFDDAGNDIGTIARWVHTTSGTKLWKVSGTKRETITSHKTVAVYADLPDSLPLDLDIDHYVQQAEALIDAIENPKLSASTTTALEDMSETQRKIFQHNHETLTSDDARILLIDMAKLQRKYDKAGKTQYDTMKKLVYRAWMNGKGHLTRGDLTTIAARLDEGTGYFQRRDKARSLKSMIEWTARECSPFPRELANQEIAERAIQWITRTTKVADKPVKVDRDNLVLGATRLAYAKTGKKDTFANSVAKRAVLNAYPITVQELANHIEKYCPEIKVTQDTVSASPVALPEINNTDPDALRGLRDTASVAVEPLANTAIMQGAARQRAVQTYRTKFGAKPTL